MKKTLKHVIRSYMSKIARLCLTTWISGIAGYSCMAMEPLYNTRPDEHLCPITFEVMRNPVVAADGHSYEKESILEWIKLNGTSPFTRDPLQNKDLIDNRALKIMIENWKPGSQSGSSLLSSRNATDIAQRVREEFKRNEALLVSAKGLHIVAFLGNTGAGKSTLVNLLAGKKIQVGAYEEDYVLVDPSDSSAMVIGTTGSSETLYPKSIDIEGLRFFDLPGFNDTDGSERNIVNAAFARKILLDAASVRLVFVVGQDQFTADRSASVRQMFNSLKNLFVLEQTADLVDNGVCVVTKVTCTPQANMTEFLLQRTASMDKADLNNQLQSWSSKNQLCRMFHPLRDRSNQDVREQILERIREAKGAKVQGINVSALYPSDTQQDLERVFLNVLEEAFIGKLKDHPVTLTAFNHMLGYYTLEDFWGRFSANLCQEDSAVGLLKEFSSIPYAKALTTVERQNREKLKHHVQDLERSFVSVLEQILEQKLKDHPVTLTEFNQSLEYYTSKDFWLKFSADLCQEANAIGLLKNSPSLPYVKALTTLEQENAGKLIEHIYNQENIPYTKAIATLKQQNMEKLKQHIEGIREERQKRVQDIEKRTEERTREVISSLVPSKSGDNFITFDFAYHRDFHDKVCGLGFIGQLATDPLEQEVVRSCYAGLISQHSHGQMMRWHEKFSGVDDLKKQLEATQQKLYALVEEPLIKVREAEPERQMIQAQELARQKAEEAERIRLSVPLVAQGHEAIYQRFLNGVLIYRPDGTSDNGRINLRISDLVNPLEGTFDLSQCGDTGNYLSISTGYRKGKRPENASKLEIWLAPRFLIEKELNTTAKHFQGIMGNWNDGAPVGMFWTWGGWENLADNFDYLTTENMDNLSKINLYENWAVGRCGLGSYSADVHRHILLAGYTGIFHVHFVN